MINAQNAKVAAAVWPAEVAKNTALTPVALDTDGFDYLTIYALVGANDAGLTALKLTECDTSGGSYTDVPNAAITNLPVEATTNKAYAFQVTLLGRKRYFKVAGSVANKGTNGSSVAVIGLLTRNKKDITGNAGNGTVETVVVI